MEDLRHRLTTQHEKDLKKLQSKLSKVEIARDELVKERNDVRNEVGILKIEARASTARETALRASVSLTFNKTSATTDLVCSWTNLRQRWDDTSRRIYKNNLKLSRRIIQIRGNERKLRLGVKTRRGRNNSRVGGD